MSTMVKVLKNKKLLKQCAECGVDKPRVEFSKRKASQDGLQRWCKSCRRHHYLVHKKQVQSYSKKYYKAHKGRAKRRDKKYYKTHKEQVQKRHREYSKKYYAEHKEQERIRGKKYYVEHKEQERIRGKKYREAHPEQIKILECRWRKDNPDKVRLRRMRRRALEKKALGACTEEQLKERIAFWGSVCYLCGATYMAIEHIVPLSRKGTNWPENLAPVCTSCNSRKRAKLLTELKQNTFPLLPQVLKKIASWSNARRSRLAS